MTDKEKEIFFSVIAEAYHKGRTSENISVEDLINEIRQKLVPVLKKELPRQKKA